MQRGPTRRLERDDPPGGYTFYPPPPGIADPFSIPRRQPAPPKTPAALILADGRCFVGQAFGAMGTVYGEVVFQTAMTGYQEVITDPSYRGQIVTFTYPHIGNYGLQRGDDQSDGPQLTGVVLRKLSRRPSHRGSTEDLSSYLARHNVMGLEGIDTRALVRHIRRFGAIPAIMTTDFEAPLTSGMAARFAAAASVWGRRVDWGLGREVGSQAPCPTVESWPSNDRPRLATWDFGIKRDIVSQMERRGLEIQLLPASASAEEILALAPDGLLLSNGPGDPRALNEIVDQLRGLLGKMPIFGICLGHQLLAMALGMEIEKLRFGHHGSNHPVLDLESRHVMITSQNHNYAVCSEALPPGVEISQLSLFDGSIEGLRARHLEAFSVQYHPEAAPGPRDADRIFSPFVDALRARAQRRLQPEASSEE